MKRQYELNYSEVQDYSKEELLASIESAVRFANYKAEKEEYISYDDIFAILGVFPREYEENKQMTQDDVEEILFGKLEEEENEQFV